MTRSNAELVEAAGEAFRRGEIDAGLALYSEDVVFIAARSAVEGPYLGHEGLRRFWADTVESFEIFEPKFTEFREVGDRLLAVGTVRVRAREGDIETEIPVAGVFEFKAGKISRWEDFRERRLALEALDLES